jgi:gas vesicle protein
MMQKFFNFLAGIFMGAVVGAVAGIMVAPASGDEIRDQFQNRADDIVADLKDAVASERQRLEAELESLKKGELKVS